MARKHTDLSRSSEFPWFPKLIATSFGVGFLPVAPGTWGAILAIILWLPLYLLCSNPWIVFVVTLAATVIYTIVGTWASTESEKYWGKDPVVACADETVGQWLTMLPLSWVPLSHWWEILLRHSKTSRHPLHGALPRRMGHDGRRYSCRNLLSRNSCRS